MILGNYISKFFVACISFAAFLTVAAMVNAPDGEDENDKYRWGYEEEKGPAFWGKLSRDYEVCATGKAQSPINLTDSTPAEIGEIIFNYHETPIDIINDGNTIQFNYEPGSSIEINGVRYELQQFHFHACSEHTIDGQYFAMEMHLVHADTDGNLAVLGVMIEPGEANHQGFVAVWEHLPTIKNESRRIEYIKINAVDLLPEDLTKYYRYNGSLTTPPCSENVLWTVFAEPVILSETQIAAFEAIYKGNFRPIQPLNDRELLHNDES